MSELDSIRLHQGIGTFLFGVSKADVINALGTEYEEIRGLDGDFDLSYPALGLEFTFWADFDHRLGIITSLRKSATLLGNKLLGSSEKAIADFIKNELKDVITDHDGCIHEDGTVQDWIDVDGLGLSFWFYDDSLYSINWTCAWKDGDTPSWPMCDQ